MKIACCFIEQVVSQPYATLNDGRKIPLIGLGTFKSTDEVMDEAVAAALRYGVRHIDCVRLRTFNIGEVSSEVGSNCHVGSSKDSTHPYTKGASSERAMIAG